jgi:mannose-6-phosphate isomerase
VGKLSNNNLRKTGWGEVRVLEEEAHYRIKRVTIHPGSQMTLHQHYHRSEHWIVIEGTVMVVCEGMEQLIPAGESTFVPACTPHRLVNPGVIPAKLMEIQNGEYLGEDDMEVVDFEPYESIAIE